eukprot:1893643-Rhodomonas_salina.3
MRKHMFKQASIADSAIPHRVSVPLPLFLPPPSIRSPNPALLLSTSVHAQDPEAERSWTSEQQGMAHQRRSGH